MNPGREYFCIISPGRTLWPQELHASVRDSKSTQKVDTNVMKIQMWRAHQDAHLTLKYVR